MSTKIGEVVFCGDEPYILEEVCDGYCIVTDGDVSRVFLFEDVSYDCLDEKAKEGDIKMVFGRKYVFKGGDWIHDESAEPVKDEKTGKERKVKKAGLFDKKLKNKSKEDEKKEAEVAKKEKEVSLVGVGAIGFSGGEFQDTLAMEKVQKKFVSKNKDVLMKMSSDELESLNKSITEALTGNKGSRKKKMMKAMSEIGMSKEVEDYCKNNDFGGNNDHVASKKLSSEGFKELKSIRKKAGEKFYTEAINQTLESFVKDNR